MAEGKELRVWPGHARSLSSLKLPYLDDYVMLCCRSPNDRLNAKFGRVSLFFLAPSCAAISDVVRVIWIIWSWKKQIRMLNRTPHLAISVGESAADLNAGSQIYYIPHTGVTGGSSGGSAAKNCGPLGDWLAMMSACRYAFGVITAHICVVRVNYITYWSPHSRSGSRAAVPWQT